MGPCAMLCYAMLCYAMLGIATAAGWMANLLVSATFLTLE